MRSKEQVLDYLRIAIDQERAVYVGECIYNYVDAIFQNQENNYNKQLEKYDSEINRINRAVDQESGRPVANDKESSTVFTIKKGLYKVKIVVLYTLLLSFSFSILMATKLPILVNFLIALLITYGVYYFFHIQPRKDGDEKIKALASDHQLDERQYGVWRKMLRNEEKSLETRRYYKDYIQSMSVVPHKYFNLNALCALLYYLESGKCSTLSEACNLYEQEASISGADTPTYTKEMREAKHTITAIKRCFEKCLTEGRLKVYIDGNEYDNDLLKRRTDYEESRHLVEKKYIEMLRNFEEA